MLSNPLKRFRGLTQSHVTSLPIWVLSTGSACGTALLLVLFGWFWELLERYSQTKSLPAMIELGPNLTISSSWLEADQGVLRGASALLAMILFIVCGITLAIYGIYKLAARTAIDRSFAQHHAVFEQLQFLTRQKSLSGMQTQLRSLIANDIPAIRDATTNWFRGGPRHLMQMLACATIAMLIDPLLASLSIIAAILVRRVFSTIDRRQRRNRPVLLERRNFAAEKLADWCASSPLLGTIHPQSITQAAFNTEISPLRKLEVAIDDHSVWKVPFSIALIALLTCALMFTAAVRVLRADVQLSAIAVIVLLLAIAIAAYSLTRMLKAFQSLGKVSRNVDHVVSLLTQPKPEVAPKTISKVELPLTKVEFQGVSLRSYSDEPLLTDITATLHRGEVIAIVADDSVEQNSLAELLLGFGRPSRGQLLFNGSNISQLSPEQIAGLSCWVSPDGPLFTGSVTENLRSTHSKEVDTANLNGNLEKTFCLEPIRALSDGLSTVISHADDRLPSDTPFRLGLARAITLQRPIVVVREPRSVGDRQIEEESRLALENIAAAGAIVIVLPARSKTLWAAHQVLFLQEGRLAAAGKHANLLEQNDAYRHWNYMKFSPHLHERMGEPFSQPTSSYM